MSREKAAERMYTSTDRLYRIEFGARPEPQEVMEMARCYQNPSLCNYYCTHECQIGQEYVPEVKMKDLAQITLETLATLNAIMREKDRLIEITADGTITKDELPDFLKIQDYLEKMSLAVSSLRLWVDQQIAEGVIDQI